MVDDTASNYASSGTSLTSGAVTTTQACDVVITGAEINTNATFSGWGSSFTEEFDFQNPHTAGTNIRSFAGADLVPAATGDYTASATASASAAWSMVIAAFKAVPATPTPTPTLTSTPTKTSTPTATATATPTTAPPIVQSSCVAGGGTDSITGSFTATPVAGDLLVAIAGSGQTAPQTFLTPAGWTQIINENSPVPSQAIFYKLAGPSEPSSVTIQLAATATDLSLQARRVQRRQYAGEHKLCLRHQQLAVFGERNDDL